ncbi:Callose synthase 9 [Glycine soja]|uniref:Callose synthase 9 n=1 Tax=Glycine soja TaxID=3848 RepID=A0A0B2R010_GLYSO|nr:Callose synthase 9 [Glycine soja]
MLISGSSRHQGKTSFVEHRTFFHLYHSFHRLWIFLFMMFQGLTILAFNDGKFNAKTLREILSLGPTFVVMKLFESVLDIFMIKALQEESKSNGNSVVFRLYVIVIGIYAGVQFFISFLMRIPACHRLTNQCGRWPLVHFVKWLRQERHYVGRGMYERSSDFIKYMLFWLVILSGKFAFAYFLQIRPLVKPTKAIIIADNINYSWHDFVSKNNHNALTVVSVWAPVVAIYLLDIYVFYTLVSAVYGFLLGARDRLGEIRSLEALHKLFEQFPGAFMDTLHVPLPNRSSHQSSVQVVENSKADAARFAPFWNEIIRNLREEDYVTNFEMELLLMPRNSGDLPLVQWPLFLLASKVFQLL